MTPERAIEIATEHDAKDDPLNIVAAILAAAAEARREALTEAANECIKLHAYMQWAVQAAEQAIIALRDREAT